MAIFVPRFVRQLRDVLLTSPADGEVLTYDSADAKWKNEAGGGGGGAPTTADYLVGTAQAGLSAEIVAGTSPGGELGGTWSAPTVDATHSGSSHAATQAAAEAASVILDPQTSARNTIAGPGDVIRAIVKAHAAQSVDLTQWQTSGGASLLAVTKLGELRQALSILDGGVAEQEYNANSFVTDFSLTLDPTGPTIDGVSNQAYKFLARNAADAKQYHDIVTLQAETMFRGTKTAPPGAGQAVNHTALFALAQTDTPSTGSMTRLKGLSTIASHAGSGTIDELQGNYGFVSLPDYGGAPRIASYMAAFVGETYVETTPVAVPDKYVFLALGGAVVAGTVTRASGLEVRNQGGANIVTSYGIRVLAQSGATTSYGLVVEGGKSVFADTLLLGLSGTPADAVFANSQGAWGADAADALPKWKGKTSGGVVVNFTPGDAALLADHSARHESGGADAIKLDDFAAPDDNTDLNASTTAHGLLRKLSNTATEYLDGAGAWSVPAGGGGGGAAEDITFTPAGTIAATDVQAAIEEVAAEASGGGMSATLFDANTILKADSDDTPVALTMGASTILARLAAGDIKAATPAELRTLLDVPTTGEAVQGYAYKSGSWITYGATGVAFATMTQSELCGFPIWVPAATTFDAMGIRVTVFAASSAVRLGVYAADDGNLPGTRLLDAGTVDSSGSNGDKTITGLSLTLQRGWYWLVGVAQGGAPTVTCITQNVTLVPFGFHPGLGATTQFNFQGAPIRHNATVTGALPATFVADLADNGAAANMPKIFLRAA